MRILQLLFLLLLTYGLPGLAKSPNHRILWGKRESPSRHFRRQADSSTSAETSTTRVADSACTNAPDSRNCWSSGYSVATDFDVKSPPGGQVVSYTLNLRNTTCNPDGGGERTCLLVNDQYPGPTIEASKLACDTPRLAAAYSLDWGDTLSITVNNLMEDNGTSIHWHGIRQLNSVGEDGVNGITECPLAPGDSKTYKFRLTQFGTAWYHSHYSAQYGDGIVGPIVINGPASYNYDIDLGPYLMNDWYYQTVFQVNDIARKNLQQLQPPPRSDNILMRGTNKNINGGGSYDKLTLTPGKRHRLRLINGAVDNNLRVSLDGHRFTVISSDFVPLKPFTTDTILLGLGQRYDVIIHANQTSDNYWLRAEPVAQCASGSSNSGRSIVSYSDAPDGEPSTEAFSSPSTCEDPVEIMPWVPNDVPEELFTSQVRTLEVDLTEEQLTTNGENLVFWGVNMSAIDVEWDKPTLEYVMEGNSSYPRRANLIEIPNSATWTYWIIQETPGTAVPIPHPIHLHGHDFYVLGHGSGVFDRETSPSTLKFRNPPRRDTSFLPGGGWIAIAFPTDNPGAWLMHCHIAWHVGEGLAVQFLESKGSINLPGQQFQDTCSKWEQYWQDPAWPKTDSGL